MEELDIVIVGGGICGLATALALYRKGIRSVVLERSETLRVTGAAIVIFTNGWRALDELGVAWKLRQAALPLQGMWDIDLQSGSLRQTPLSYVILSSRSIWIFSFFRACVHTILFV
uniref:3-hydroxybenzoate 6-hydroxylase 1 n=1 Tax=Rhizophora mucronata TaxID=61149 RepID=A0A2P2KDC0_RHIMU